MRWWSDVSFLLLFSHWKILHCRYLRGLDSETAPNLPISSFNPFCADTNTVYEYGLAIYVQSWHAWLCPVPVFGEEIANLSRRRPIKTSQTEVAIFSSFLLKGCRRRGPQVFLLKGNKRMTSLITSIDVCSHYYFCTMRWAPTKFPPHCGLTTSIVMSNK